MTQPNTFPTDFAVFDSARRVSGAYDSPLHMDDMAAHAIDAALDNFTSVCLLITRGTYPTEKWWEYATRAISTTAKDTAMLLAVITSAVSDTVPIEAAVVPARNYIARGVRSGESNPCNPLFEAVAAAMKGDVNEEIPRVRSTIMSWVYETYGDELVELGEISQDELIEHQAEAATSMTDLNDELAAAFEFENSMDDIENGKRADNSGDTFTLKIPVKQDSIMDDDNAGDIDALRYLYDGARDDMIELISTDTFSPQDAAGSDAAKRLADVFEFEPLIMALVSEFSPSVRVLSHIYDAAGHETMSHVNLASAMAFVLSKTYADSFIEDDESVSFEPSPEFNADLALVRSVIEDASNVDGTGVSIHALTTWTEHEMGVSVLAATAMEDSDDETAQQAAYALRLLSNPFNKSLFSALFVLGFGEINTAGFVSQFRLALWENACNLSLGLIRGDEDAIERLRHMG